MLLGDHRFLFDGVAAYIDDFHTVAQGRLYASQTIGRRDKHDLRQVIAHFQEVVVKRFVLLGI